MKYSNLTQGRAVLHNLGDCRVVVRSSCTRLFNKGGIYCLMLEIQNKHKSMCIATKCYSCLVQDWHIGVGELSTKVESCVRRWSQQGLQVHLNNNNNIHNNNDNNNNIMMGSARTSRGSPGQSHRHISFFLITQTMTLVITKNLMIWWTKISSLPDRAAQWRRAPGTALRGQTLDGSRPS